MGNFKFKAWDRERRKFFTSPKWVEWGIDISGNLTAKNLKPNRSEYQNLLVCQYTGSMDKNGEEIYSGHKVRIKKKNIFGEIRGTHVITYVEQSGRFHAEGTTYENLAEFIYDDSGKNCAEIVGHIYED